MSKVAIIGSVQVPDFTEGKTIYYGSGFYIVDIKGYGILNIDEIYVFNIPSLGYWLEKNIFKRKKYAEYKRTHKTSSEVSK